MYFTIRPSLLSDNLIKWCFYSYILKSKLWPHFVLLYWNYARWQPILIARTSALQIRNYPNLMLIAEKRDIEKSFANTLNSHFYLSSITFKVFTIEIQVEVSIINITWVETKVKNTATQKVNQSSRQPPIRDYRPHSLKLVASFFGRYLLTPIMQRNMSERSEFDCKCLISRKCQSIKIWLSN